MDILFAYNALSHFTNVKQNSFKQNLLYLLKLFRYLSKSLEIQKRVS